MGFKKAPEKLNPSQEIDDRLKLLRDSLSQKRESLKSNQEKFPNALTLLQQKNLIIKKSGEFKLTEKNNPIKITELIKAAGMNPDTATIDIK